MKAATSPARLVARALLVAARIVFAACALFLAIWLVYGGTIFWRNDEYWPQSKLSNVHACKDSVVSPTCSMQKVLYSNLLFLWLTPAVMALSAILILALRPMTESISPGSKTSHWSSYMLPPRRFWLAWCGGLTVGDLLIICLWAVVNASWMSAIVGRNQARLLAKAAKSGLSKPPAHMVATMVARSFGSLLAPNLVALFYPVTRGSVVLQALGVSYPDAIRYHRWLGHAVMTILTLHGVMYWAIWINRGEWVHEALEQGSGHNNLMGGLAFIFGLSLWITASDFVRRRNYSLFKTLHHIGFWGFMVFGVCHYWSMVWYFLPGLVLYGIDAVFRLHQAVFESGSGVKVLHAAVSADGSICSLVIEQPGFALAESGCVWLCVPELSWFSWHPFDYLAIPTAAFAMPNVSAATAVNSNEDQQQQQQQKMVVNGYRANTHAMLIHVKAYSRWSKRLVDLLVSQGTNIKLKVQGPYADVAHSDLLPAEFDMAEPGVNCLGCNSAKASTPDGLVIIAGGNGIAASLSIFQQLSTAAAAGLPTLLVWCCRKAGEFELMAPRVLAMAQDLGLNLTTKFYYTGPLPLPFSTHELQLKSHKTIQHTSTTAHDTHAPTDKVTKKPVQTHAAATSQMEVSSNSDGVGNTDHLSSMCPMVAVGGIWGKAVQKAAMHIAVFAGVFAAILIARYITLVQPNQPWPTAHMGATYLALILAFIIIPGTLVLWAALLVQKLTKSRSHKAQTATLDMASNFDQVESGCPRLGHSSTSGPAAAVAAVVGAGAQARLTSVASSKLAHHTLMLELQSADSWTGGPKTAYNKPAMSETSKQGAQALSSVGLAGSASTAVPVAIGRSPLQQLVRSWLATLQQLPKPGELQAAAAERKDTELTGPGAVVAADNVSSSSSSSSGAGSSSTNSDMALKCVVYAMGPQPLVHECRLLCADLNASANQKCQLKCIVKTHQL